MTTRNRFESVWDAMESPHEAVRLKAKAALANALIVEIERRALTQDRAATLLAVSKTRVSDLIRGRVDLFSLDTLVEMAGRIGFQVAIELSRRKAA